MIAGFAQGDTIDLIGLSETVSAYSGGILTLTGDQTVNLHIPGAFNKASFGATPDAGTGTNIFVVPCFAHGTRIATERGDVPVETLRAGDRVRLARREGFAPINWIGHRSLDCTRHPRPDTVWPVCVRAGAFGPGLPFHDLWLSPDHAVFVDDVLIPVKHLINGTTIAQIPVDHVSYYHVELPTHDVLLAEGLPTESLLDTCDRSVFNNGSRGLQLHPDFYGRMWDAQGCARLIVTGPRLALVRRNLDARVNLLHRMHKPATRRRAATG